MYLDQSALSELLREPERAGLLALLRRLVAEGSVLCPQSMSHQDESILSELYEQLEDLADELSAGVSFEFDDEFTRWKELAAAAASFLGEPPTREVWFEAFVDNPQKPLEELHPAFRVRIRNTRQDWMVEEVKRERAKAEPLGPVRDAIRASGRTFAEQADLEYRTLIEAMLEPLRQPERHETRLQRVALSILAESETGPVSVIGGSPYSRYEALMRGAHCESLIERYPALTDRLSDFVDSKDLASMPSLRFPALFHAALASGSRRRPKPSDLHDIAHLTNGLGRCDIVTCDSSMAQLCREFRLVPEGVLLFSARELDDLERALGS